MFFALRCVTFFIFRPAGGIPGSFYSGVGGGWGWLLEFLRILTARRPWGVGGVGAQGGAGVLRGAGEGGQGEAYAVERGDGRSMATTDGKGARRVTGSTGTFWAPP